MDPTGSSGVERDVARTQERLFVQFFQANRGVYVLDTLTRKKPRVFKKKKKKERGNNGRYDFSRRANGRRKRGSRRYLGMGFVSRREREGTWGSHGEGVTGWYLN